MCEIMQQLVPIGIIIVFIGVIILTIGVVFSVIKQKQTKAEGGFVFFLGPFPILGGATRREIFYALLAVSVILILAFLFISRKI